MGRHRKKKSAQKRGKAPPETAKKAETKRSLSAKQGALPAPDYTRPRIATPLILVFLAFNLAVPALYYRQGRDKHDERFAWRMFSPTRMTRCQVQFRVGAEPKPISMVRTFHQAWRTLAARGRAEIIDGMTAHLCEKNPGQAVRVTLHCKYLGSKRPTVIHDGRADRCEVAK